MVKIIVKDFFAVWCPPCQMQTPVIKTLEKDPEFKDKVLFKKIDVDKNKEEAENYGIQSIPTIIIEKEDEIVAKMVGFQSEEILRQKIRDALK